MGLSAADKENAGGEVEMGDLDSLKVNMEEVTDDAAAQQKKRNRLVKVSGISSSSNPGG